MSKTIRIRKGLDIRLVGEADKVRQDLDLPTTVCINPSDFHGMMPKLNVKEGDTVQAGSILFHDKYNEAIRVASPVSGTVTSINRGDKRKILSVIVTLDAAQSHIQFGIKDPNTMTGEEVKNHISNAGMWPLIKQRPLDVVANPTTEPKAIFISGFDSSPLAPDFDYMLHADAANMQAGINALAKMTVGKVYLTIKGASTDASIKQLANVEISTISGPHPAGNVGVQIHHISPINKGETVWTVNLQDVVILGKLFTEGVFNASKTIALTGSEANHPKYFRTIIGANVEKMLVDNLKSDNVRIVSGNALTGLKIDATGYLHYYHNQVTLLPEGNQPKFFLTKGWLSLGFDRFSNSKLYPTWMMKNKKYVHDTNLNGEERAFVVTGELEKVFPFDIYPMQLVKAAITNDIDGMEQLGIYEVAPEDFALCEYVCTSKINIQEKVRAGLDLIQKECM
jgi:Na+-transporting NADH:ubiquinone oxidoreductase subunit A